MVSQIQEDVSTMQKVAGTLVVSALEPENFPCMLTSPALPEEAASGAHTENTGFGSIYLRF